MVNTFISKISYILNNLFQLYFWTQLIFLSRSWFKDKIITALGYKNFITKNEWCPYQYWPFYRIPRLARGFYKTSWKMMLSKQLTPLDTWSCPIWDLYMFCYWNESLQILSFLQDFELEYALQTIRKSPDTLDKSGEIASVWWNISTSS